MSVETHEAEVAGIEFVGPHSTRPDAYEIIVTLAGKTAAPARLSLLFRPTEAMLLARMMQWSPPRVEVQDHVLADIEHLQT
jgi:hypothetical protein